ncbi:MAG: aspartate carbamoyltransferase regulatory subunit [Thermococcaceae archaeon]|jgi:aspartate carbamoyltransferase regulatory subunit|uniref:aspartate carbamoyltransferase regulatory subunit n=1 Tax=Thermococcus TaxID=2263 RepID=UPI0005B29DC2|nr:MULTISPECIES: aspartate carbamoyltransferase regulatory subunit [Thermococcus]KUK00201.1 MAG: Aspartate carbamoyltransferase regulatory chain [Thermococcales archaeon 44_46]MDK2783780.1 aspartate carbamoyltransferase regulatory subunit [Thermococcaceae archaeon]MCA6213069.1 aspartate carbamoyltransferase regulatory subunit [Thermococcus bergensis]MDK2983759.1 aspartate carbamoyltransferase regulatory subunit [Thermococcaceae archaeon]MDN5319949.1 aspartate carbamoyltransferase regulatory su
MKELKVSAINKGTVIDHIPAGRGLKVLEILNLPEDSTILVAINVRSEKLGKKDIIKVEGKILSEEEVNKIALIAPSATVNIIDNWEVVEKRNVEVPDEIVGIINCANPNCITHYEEVKPKFKVISKRPLKLKCYYCERTMEEDTVLKNLL